MFLTAVNPVYTYQHQEEAQYDLDKPRIAVYKNTWKFHQNTVLLVQFEACSEERIAVISNTILRNHSFQHYLRYVIEKVVNMKAGEEFCTTTESLVELEGER